MRNRTIYLSMMVLAVSAMLTGAAGCGVLQRPTASIAGVSVQNVGVTSATMLFDVKVDNPYAVALPLSNLDYALSSEGQQFLTGAADVAGTIPAGASKTLPLPVKISYLELVRAVKGARPGVAVPYKADLGLSVDTPVFGALRLPMTKTGQISIPTASSLLEQLEGLVP